MRCKRPQCGAGANLYRFPSMFFLWILVEFVLYYMSSTHILVEIFLSKNSFLSKKMNMSAKCSVIFRIPPLLVDQAFLDHQLKWTRGWNTNMALLVELRKIWTMLFISLRKLHWFSSYEHLKLFNNTFYLEFLNKIVWF